MRFKEYGRACAQRNWSWYREYLIGRDWQSSLLASAGDKLPKLGGGGVFFESGEINDGCISGNAVVGR